MNPQNSQPQEPIMSTASQTSTTNSHPDSSWKTRLRALNWPQRLLALVAAVLAVLLISLALYQAFHKQTPLAPAVKAPTTALVSITSSGLSPATITIKAGTQLTWTNNDSKPHQPAADPHPLHNSIAGFDSDTILQSGDSLSFKFETPGTYTYHDHLNPLNKHYQGTIIVK